MSSSECYWCEDDTRGACQFDEVMCPRVMYYQLASLKKENAYLKVLLADAVEDQTEFETEWNRLAREALIGVEHDAADEIERLRAEVETMESLVKMASPNENARLREALEKIAGNHQAAGPKVWEIARAALK